jgi:hypothetical protein
MEGDETILDCLALIEIFARLAEWGRKLRTEQSCMGSSNGDDVDNATAPIGDAHRLPKLAERVMAPFDQKDKP